ncbi:MAG: DUF1566 domain-containing protein [Sulfuritalea sp.]|nr:DUF1566 domain-containing protein [Sulfuritalea sp.]
MRPLSLLRTAAVCLTLPLLPPAVQAGTTDRYVALDARGKPTAPRSGARPHPCVLDTATGLIWEVKTDDGGPADKDWTFTWFASRPDAFAINVGYVNGGRCAAKSRCDTEGYVAATNKRGLCGRRDWRLPGVEELEGLLRPATAGAKIDPRFFPNTQANYYWTGSYVPTETGGAMFVSFELGMALLGNSASAASVRLVRGPDQR